MTESGVNVEAAASYTGKFFSMSGSMTLDTSQHQSASHFQQETTQKTISVGSAPPADGDAMKWASSVLENPVPVSYDLKLIDKLFTKHYMHHLNIDHDELLTKVEYHLERYCDELMRRRELNTCEGLTPGIELQDVRLQGFFRTFLSDEDTCIESCMRDVNCVAISMCFGCIDHEFFAGRCFQYKSVSGFTSIYSDSRSKHWVTFIIQEKILHDFTIHHSRILGSHRQGSSEDLGRANTTDECRERCVNDIQCVAFSVRGIKNQNQALPHILEEENDNNCLMFGSGRGGLESMEYDHDSLSVFVTRRNSFPEYADEL